MTMRTQRGYRVHDTGKEKRQRCNSAGRWAVSKGNDLVDTEESDSKGGKKGVKEVVPTMYLLSTNNMYRLWVSCIVHAMY